MSGTAAARSALGKAALVALGLVTDVGLASAQPSSSSSSSSSSSCFPDKAAAGPGDIDPFHVVDGPAAQLNVDGKVLYRKGLWEDARAKYRAALEADADFVAPRLNIACSFVRQERFLDATTEVVRILDRAYLPWWSEISAAADLGALKVRKEWNAISEAKERSRRIWAEGLNESLLFVARTRQPLGFGDHASGVFVLGPRQEIFAWSPRTLRTRQITAEDGRVLAILPARDQARVAYVIGEKVIREAGNSRALRGLSIVVMDLSTLLPLGRRTIDGDMASVGLAETTGDGFVFRLATPEGRQSAIRFEKGTWLALPSAVRSPASAVVLLPTGIQAGAQSKALRVTCAGVVREISGRDGRRSLTVQPSKMSAKTGRPAPMLVGGGIGAGLSGLPIP